MATTSDRNLENGLAQLFHINDTKILDGVHGPGADLTQQTDIYAAAIKNSQLTPNDFDDVNTYQKSKQG